MTASDIENLRKVLFDVDRYDSEILKNLRDSELSNIFTPDYLFQTANVTSFKDFLKGNSLKITTITEFANSPKNWRDHFVSSKTNKMFSCWEDWRDYAMICYRGLA